MAEPNAQPQDDDYEPSAKLDDESSLAKEEALGAPDHKKELSSLEEEANLPIEEVLRRMQEAAGDDDDEEEEFDEDEEDSDEDSGEEDDESGEEGDFDEEEEEEDDDAEDVRTSPRRADPCHRAELLSLCLPTHRPTRRRR